MWRISAWPLSLSKKHMENMRVHAGVGADAGAAYHSTWHLLTVHV